MYKEPPINNISIYKCMPTIALHHKLIQRSMLWVKQCLNLYPPPYHMCWTPRTHIHFNA